jgi:hypothetical protein
MKWSNSALAVVAAFFVALAAFAAKPTIITKPTAVISVTTESGTIGGGFSMNLPKNLTARQAEVLSLAYSIAKKDGHKQPQLLQGIVMQESHAGQLGQYKVAGQEFGLRINERYYGVAQIKLGATRDVLSRYPHLLKQFNFQTNTDEEVIAKLIENDAFNLTIASKYLLILQRYGFDTIRELALAYNQGPGGAKSKDSETFHYSNGVMKHIQTLQHKKI